jgi:D-alanine--D-alanine ligase
MKICIICSGVSDEKSISVNSAKSISEILDYYDYHLEVVFITENFEFVLLEKTYLFSNTVEDFLHLYKKIYIITDYISYLKNFDIIFLTTHGSFGEDGSLQKILDQHHIPYVGENYFSSFNTFYKQTALQLLWDNKICEKWSLEIYTNPEQITFFLKKYKTFIIKPNNGGSSIGVHICHSYEEAIKTITELQNKNYTPLLEKMHYGREFSISVIRGEVCEITEIINEGIFTYKKKYFPSEEVSYRNPAKFPQKIITKIKNDSLKIYNIFRCRDFLRIDGFYLSENKQIIYTDFNTLPGFQLNGLFFKKQSHFEVIKKILRIPNKQSLIKKKKKIYVVFGGDSAERNISIISGSNIIFNLSKEDTYEVIPFLLNKKKFWSLKYEECFQTSIKDFSYILKEKKAISMNNFIFLCKKDNSIVFLGLHGGIGENGILQNLFQKNHIPYTGSNSTISALCMNKYKTNLFIQNQMRKNKYLYYIENILLKNFIKISTERLKNIWPDWQVFIKPNDDGCSVGAMLLSSLEDLYAYQLSLQNKDLFFRSTPMSLHSKDYILCKYIKVDNIQIIKNEIIYRPKTYWIECTIGTLGSMIFPPSVCITTSTVLTMEDKFLYGTGTNLTPIPEKLIKQNQIKIIQQTIKKIIQKIKINTYCRIDFFYNIKKHEILIIEINTLPALTPSTVLFQQAIKYNITPKILMKKILFAASSKRNSSHMKS